MSGRYPVFMRGAHCRALLHSALDSQVNQHQNDTRISDRVSAEVAAWAGVGSPPPRYAKIVLGDANLRGIVSCRRHIRLTCLITPIQEINLMSLMTSAEQAADRVRNLPGFSNLSLPGLRKQIADMLSLIGREGIFSTYTRHDISHIDAMLLMLEWIIPIETQKALTPVDWLLIVLGIYFHDLGMIVTSAEFEDRVNNDQFNSWRSSLSTTTDGLEYLARIHRMTEDERERFFYQEYVRKGHAQRIREWITGRHTRNWGSQVSTIASAVKNLLESTPSRFREYLGVVCESHHRPDLDRV
jgi:hypothetical protein